MPTHLQLEHVGGWAGPGASKWESDLTSGFLFSSPAAGWRQRAGRLDGAFLLPVVFSRGLLFLHHSHSEQGRYNSDTGHAHPWTSHTCELVTKLKVFCPFFCLFAHMTQEAVLVPAFKNLGVFYV